MQLSENFHLDEMTFSQTAARMGRCIVPTDEQIQNIEFHCQIVLQPVRDLLGCPVIVTSGIRPKWLNHAIGGSLRSQHMKGEATDIKCVSDRELIDIADDIARSDIPFDQLILEFGQWIHISSSQEPRREVLTAYRNENGVTAYEKGLWRAQ